MQRDNVDESIVGIFYDKGFIDGLHIQTRYFMRSNVVLKKKKSTECPMITTNVSAYIFTPKGFHLYEMREVYYLYFQSL